MRPIYQGSKNIVSIHLCSRSYIFLKVTLTFISFFISLYLFSFFFLRDRERNLLTFRPSCPQPWPGSFTETSSLFLIIRDIILFLLNGSQCFSIIDTRSSYHLLWSSNLPSTSHRNSFSSSSLFSFTFQFLLSFSLSQYNTIKVIKVTSTNLEQRV